MVLLPPEQERLTKVVFPYMWERQASVRSRGIRFVHYTNADAAMNILRSKEVWMRKSTSMNDFMEVQHGLNCIRASYNTGASGKKFKDTLNSLFDGITSEIEKPFNDWTQHFLTNTYLTCVSEHEDFEDTFGRLSMWRAYSESTGVALVLNAAPFFGSSTALKAYVSPVAYLSDQEFEAEFETVANNILNEREFIRSWDRNIIANTAFQALRWAAICTKHPGFDGAKDAG
jgi:Protein of unknown function (DUF2971)